MGYSERCDKYKQIEEIRGRPLISYVTSSRSNDGGGRMGYDVIPEFCDQLLKIPDSEKNIDILIVSNGGDPIVAWRIITILRERFENIGVLVPFSATSAATLLALGADEIVMHKFSNFGPVDPQINLFDANGNPIQFSADSITNYLDFVKNDAGVNNQDGIGIAFEHLCENVRALDLGVAKKSMKLTESLSKKLLLTHMKDDKKVNKIVSALNTSFYHHGYTIGRLEAKELELPVIDSDEKLENLIWDVWTDFEKDMKCRIPFDPMMDVITNPEYASKFNINPEMPMKECYDNLLRNIPQNGYTFYLELCHAAVESLRLNSDYVSVKQYSISRTPDLKVNHNLTPINNGYWRKINVR